MSKVALSPTGIGELEAYLHALGDPALFAEADAVRLDFVGWVDDHIELTSPQLTWLSDIDELFLDYLGIKTAIALRNRLPLNIELPPIPEDPEWTAKSGKWFLDKDPISPKWEEPGVITATGQITFKLGYDT